MPRARLGTGDAEEPSDGRRAVLTQARSSLTHPWRVKTAAAGRGDEGGAESLARTVWHHRLYLNGKAISAAVYTKHAKRYICLIRRPRRKSISRCVPVPHTYAKRLTKPPSHVNVFLTVLAGMLEWRRPSSPPAECCTRAAEDTSRYRVRAVTKRTWSSGDGRAPR